MALQQQPLQIPLAARFVPRTAPLSLHWLLAPEQPAAYARAVAQPRQRRQAAAAMDRLRDGAFAAAGLDYYEHYLEDLSKITRQDITDYVRRYIQGQPYVLGMAMSKPAAIITEPSLKRYGRP